MPLRRADVAWNGGVAAAYFLAAKLGLQARRDKMGNLIVEIGPQNSGKSLMLMAYAMTHPASRMKEPYAGELIGTGSSACVRGRGVSEQKGSLAAALASTLFP